MPTLEDNRWTPVRRGAIYCSPACGGGCTHQAYLEAQVQAQEMLDALGGPTTGGNAWEKRVHENLGWYGSVRLVINGQVVAQLQKNRNGYSCYIESNPQFVADGETPRDAVQRALLKLECVKQSITLFGHAVAASLKGMQP